MRFIPILWLLMFGSISLQAQPKWNLLDHVALPASSLPGFIMGGSIFATSKGTLLTTYYADSFGRGSKAGIRRSTDNGATWYEAYKNSSSYAGVRFFVSDKLGNIFAAGDVSNGTENRWFVLSSMDDGHTWSEVDSFTCTATGYRGTVYSLNIDSHGKIISMGSCKDDVIIRSSPDGIHWTQESNTQPGYWVMGLNLGLQDEYYAKNSIGQILQQENNKGNYVWKVIEDSSSHEGYLAFHIDSKGSFYILANLKVSVANMDTFFIKFSNDRGQNWTKIKLPDITNPQIFDVMPRDLFIARNGDLYVIYNIFTELPGLVMQTEIQVMKSSDQGVSWETVFTPSQAHGYLIHQISPLAEDADGRIYFTGGGSLPADLSKSESDHMLTFGTP